MNAPARRTPTARSRSLADLGVLRQALRRRERERLEAEAERLRREEAARHERELFARTVGPVQPLRPTHRRPHESARPPAEARQRMLDEQAVLHEALSDEMDVERLLETDEALSYRRDGLGPEVVRKLRRGVWVVHAELDLHGLRSDEARLRLAAFLHEALRRGWRCVRIVHGKGHGSPGRVPVLKQKVPRWLIQKDEVMAFVQARASDGGAGALVVLLRPA